MAKAYTPEDVGAGWWRDIPGYRGRYQASRAGGIRKVFTSGLVQDKAVYKRRKRSGNALFTKLTIDGKSKEVSVLRIMAATWHNNQDKNLVPYHKNMVSEDNRADNIGFITREGLGRLSGHRTGRRKSVFKVAESGEEVEVYRSAREAARKNHMSYQSVLDRCHNRVKNPFALDGYTYQFER